MRILVLNPPGPKGVPFVREGRCMNRLSTWSALWPPLTLMYIASVLKKRRHEVLLIDGLFEPENALLTKIRNFSPDLSVLNTSTPTIEEDLRWASKCKGISGKVCLIGVHPTADYEEMLKRPEVDFVALGEPERTIEELSLSIGSPKNVRGIAYRAGKGIVKATREREFEANLDSLPFPDRDSIDNSRYTLPFSLRKFTLVNTSRGCPHACIYCTASIFYGKSFRTRSPRSIVDEISECVERHGIRDFLFWSDEFTFDRKQVLGICREMRKRRLDVRWFANSRVDTADSHLLSEMRSAGCWLLSFGIESADQGILDRSLKGAKVWQAKKAVEDARRQGIRTIGHFIFGLPGETRATAKKTLHFAKSLPLDYAQFYVALPYKGTPFYRYSDARGNIVDKRRTSQQIGNSVIREGALSNEELSSIRRKSYLEFYLRPRQILLAAGDILSSGPGIVRGIRNALNFLFDWGEVSR